jgi:hypothetical protein
MYNNFTRLPNESWALDIRASQFRILSAIFKWQNSKSPHHTVTQIQKTAYIGSRQLVIETIRRLEVLNVIRVIREHRKKSKITILPTANWTLKRELRKDQKNTFTKLNNNHFELDITHSQFLVLATIDRLQNLNIPIYTNVIYSLINPPCKRTILKAISIIEDLGLVEVKRSKGKRSIIVNQHIAEKRGEKRTQGREKREPRGVKKETQTREKREPSKEILNKNINKGNRSDAPPLGKGSASINKRGKITKEDIPSKFLEANMQYGEKADVALTRLFNANVAGKKPKEVAEFFIDWAYSYNAKCPHFGDRVSNFEINQYQTLALRSSVAKRIPVTPKNNKVEFLSALQIKEQFLSMNISI